MGLKAEEPEARLGLWRRLVIPEKGVHLGDPEVASVGFLEMTKTHFKGAEFLKKFYLLLLHLLEKTVRFKQHLNKDKSSVKL